MNFTNLTSDDIDDIIFSVKTSSNQVELLKRKQEYSIWHKSEAESAFLDIRNSVTPINPSLKSPYLQNFNEAFAMAIDKDIPFYTGKSSQFDINTENMNTVACQKRLLLSDGTTPITKSYARKKGATSFVVFSTLVEQQATMLEEYMITKFSDILKNICINNGTSGTSFVSQVDIDGNIIYRVFITIYNGLEDMFNAGQIQICRMPRILKKAAPLLPEQVQNNAAFQEKLRNERKQLVQVEWKTNYDLLTEKLNKDYSSQNYDSIMKSSLHLKKWCFGQHYLLNSVRGGYANKEALEKIGFLNYMCTDYAVLLVPNSVDVVGTVNGDGISDDIMGTIDGTVNGDGISDDIIGTVDDDGMMDGISDDIMGTIDGTVNGDGISDDIMGTVDGDGTTDGVSDIASDVVGTDDGDGTTDGVSDDNVGTVDGDGMMDGVIGTVDGDDNMSVTSVAPLLNRRKRKVAPLLNHRKIKYNQRIKVDVKFEDRLAQLTKYKEENGNCNVPREFKGFPKLGSWVTYMRDEYKKYNDGKYSTLTDEKIKSLDKLDFVWKINYTFEDRLAQLTKYKEKNGNCNVPREFKGFRKLGKWVGNQRRYYRNFKENKTGQKLTKENIISLETLGIEWSFTPTFEERLVQFAAYKKKYGKCTVPCTFEGYDGLGTYMRNLPSKTEAKISAFENIGYFIPSRRRKGKQTNDMN